MTRLSSHELLAALHNPSSPAELLKSLKVLKHQFIGHQQVKEKWIEHGIVAPLARILSAYRARPNRRRNESNGFSARPPHQEEITVEEDICLQAVILIGSLAQGGPRFLPALVSGRVVPPMLLMLSPKAHFPQLTLAVLRTLNTIADAILLEGSRFENSETDALKVLYENDSLTYISEVLDQDSQHLITQQQISFAAGLIIKTCRTENRRKAAAAHSEVLVALARCLASFVIARTHPLFVKDRRGVPLPATTISRLEPLLQAIATVIAESKSRASRFVAESTLKTAVSEWSDSRGGNNPLDNSSLDSIMQALPRESATVSSRPGNFPPLGDFATSGKAKYKGSAHSFSNGSYTVSVSDEEKAPLAYWLAHIAKEEKGHAKLMVAWVLALLFRSGFGGKRLERILGMQIVPVVTSMLDSDNGLPMAQLPPYDSSILMEPKRLIKEQAPRVLGLLVGDNEDLQTAAQEAAAIKKLSQLLKRSYDPLPPNPATNFWSPDPASGMNAREYSGHEGLSPNAYHVLQTRESVISALAAMVTFQDDLRMSVINSGIVPFIIQSLEIDPGTRNKEDKKETDGEKLYNTIPVLLAACEAATALSRSVGTLRTSLIDAGLDKPIYQLLKHPDIDVQVAATGAVVNIILEFSPMRTDMISAGVQTILCEHAHSNNAKLQLNSLWALKHLVYTASPELKKRCLEELGSGWLKQTIQNDTDFGFGFGSGVRGGGVDYQLTMESSNAAGEQVDLLNSTDDTNIDTQSYDDDEDDEVNMIDSIGALSRPSGRSRQRPYSAGLRDEEAETAAQTKRDNIAIQEQGLDFIRNLLSGDGSPEIIDYVFQELGQDKLFDILASLLRHRPVDGPSRDRRVSGGSVRVAPPHTEVVISVCYILVHLAAGLNRHRQMLISHPELLKQMVPIFGHSSAEARTACAWVIINLTWTDNGSDPTQARARAYELRKLGVDQKLEECKDDPIMDVRERIKQAQVQMDTLLN